MVEEDGEKKGWVPRKERKTRDLVVPGYEMDLELVAWLADFLGCSRAEAIRTAIRSFAGQMKALQKEIGRPKGS